MKKSVIVALLLTLAMSFAACGSADNTEKTSAKESSIEETSASGENIEADETVVNEVEEKEEAQKEEAVEEEPVHKAAGTRADPFHFGEELVFENMSRSFKSSDVDEGYTLKITIDEAWPEGDTNDTVHNVPVFKYHFTLLNDEQTEATPATGLFKVDLISEPNHGGIVTEYEGCSSAEAIVPGIECTAIAYSSKSINDVTPTYVRVIIKATDEQFFIAFP